MRLLQADSARNVVPKSRRRAWLDQKDHNGVDNRPGGDHNYQPDNDFENLFKRGFDFARIAAGEVHIDAVDGNQNDGAEKGQAENEVQRRLDSGQQRAKIA